MVEPPMMAPAQRICSLAQPPEQDEPGEENGNDAKKMKMFTRLLNKTDRTKCAFTPVISLHYQNGAGSCSSISICPIRNHG